MPATLLLTDALADQLADAVRRAVPIETAVQAAGISQQTFYEWLRAAESGRYANGAEVSPASRKAMLAFSEKIRRAQAEAEAQHIQAIAEAGASVGRNGVPEWRARAWLLNNHPRYRERYREHRQTVVEHGGTVLHEHTLAKQLEQPALEGSYQALESLPDQT